MRTSLPVLPRPASEPQCLRLDRPIFHPAVGAVTEPQVPVEVVPQVRAGLARSLVDLVGVTATRALVTGDKPDGAAAVVVPLLDRVGDFLALVVFRQPFGAERGQGLALAGEGGVGTRSEERRVGKE